MKTIRDLDVRQKKVLVRCDFNVPLSEDGIVLDDFRIQKTLPTIEYLIEENAKIILISHLGEPKGEVVEKFKLTPIQEKLTDFLAVSIAKAPDCIGEEVENLIQKMKFGEILLLENLRFHKEEEENNDNFAKELAKLADIYINDAFGVCHRKHASVVGIPKCLESGEGFLLEKEITILNNFLLNSRHPVLAIIGGAKVETKTSFIDKISEVADCVLIGGLLAKELKEKNIHSKNFQKIKEPIDQIFDGKDIGPQTVDLFERKILSANTIFWNGPLGKIEEDEFSDGTECIARFIADATGRAFTIIGGGETVEFASKLGLIEKFNHVSTGGGAMLAFLSGEKLPGIEALKNYGGN